MTDVKKSMIIKFILNYLKSNNLLTIDRIKSSISNTTLTRTEVELSIPIYDDELRNCLKKELVELKKYQPFEINDDYGFTTHYLFNDCSVDIDHIKFLSTDEQLENLIELLNKNFKQ